MSRVEGFQRSLARSMVSKILGRQGFPCEVHGFKGIMMSKSPKVPKALGRQVSKVK